MKKETKLNFSPERNPKTDPETNWLWSLFCTFFAPYSNESPVNRVKRTGLDSENQELRDRLARKPGWNESLEKYSDAVKRAESLASAYTSTTLRPKTA